MGTSAGGVHIYDVKNMISRPSTTVDYENAATSFLSVDDVIDLNTGFKKIITILKSFNGLTLLTRISTGRITIASWKGLITDSEYYPDAIPSSDILSSSKSNQWLSTVLRLVDNRSDKNVTSLSLETGPQFQAVHDRSFALSYGGNSPYPGREFMYSYTNVRVSIREV
jgi:hypothetical protein